MSIVHQSLIELNNNQNFQNAVELANEVSNEERLRRLEIALSREQRAREQLEEKIERGESQILRLNRTLTYIGVEMGIAGLNYLSLITPAKYEILSLIRIFPTYFLVKTIVNKLETNFLKCETVFNKFICETFRQIVIFTGVYYLFLIGKATILVSIETFLQVWNTLSGTNSLVMTRFSTLLDKLSTQASFRPIADQLSDAKDVFSILKKVLKQVIEHVKDYSRFQKLITLGDAKEYYKTINYLNKKLEIAIEEGEHADAEKYRNEINFLADSIIIEDGKVFPVDDSYGKALNYLDLLNQISQEEFENSMKSLFIIDSSFQINPNATALIPPGYKFDDIPLIPDSGQYLDSWQDILRPVSNLLNLEKTNITKLEEFKPVETAILNYYDDFKTSVTQFEAPILNKLLNNDYVIDFVKKTANDLQDAQIDIFKEVNRGVSKLAETLSYTLAGKLLSDGVINKLPTTVQQSEKFLTYVPEIGKIKEVLNESNEVVVIGFSVVQILLFAYLFTFIVAVFTARGSKYFKRWRTPRNLQQLQQSSSSSSNPTLPVEFQSQSSSSSSRSVQPQIRRRYSAASFEEEKE